MAQSVQTSIRSAEVQRFLLGLPNSAAKHLQAVVKKNHLEHKAEIVRTLKLETPEARRRMSFAIKVFPRGFREPKKISDVEGETVSFWRGRGQPNPKEGAAWKLDVSGDPRERPKRVQFLVIPWSGKRGAPRSPLMTTQGRPRRTKSLRDIANVFFKGLHRSNKVLIAFRNRRGKEEDQPVALLMKASKHVQGMDFFGAWARLEKSRNERFERMKDLVA